ncbi:MAG TPA: ATP-binding cassette domain-containing protein [Acidobacteriota bacterium]|nr:ATP-binding cassette domain-containing protein [Acidobacteriota bacterium]
MLKVNNLQKSYGDVRAVDGVTFEIAEGGVFGLLGPNGAGKTTTIHIVAQVIRPDSGSVTVDGLELGRNGSRVKGLIGFVPQELAIYHDLTARENLAMFGKVLS